MEYKVVYSSHEYLAECNRILEHKVNELLGDGWKLQGGVSIATKRYGTVGVKYSVFQAMIKE